MRIPVIIEPDYSRSVWCERTLTGLNSEIVKKKYDLSLIDGAAYQSVNYNALFESDSRLLIMIGTSVSWIPKTIDFFKQQNIQSILVSYQPPEHTMLRGVVRMDYVSAMHKLLTYLRAVNKPRISLYGFNPNSSADRIKERYYISWAHEAGVQSPDSNVFYNYASLVQCFEGFRMRVSRYDAVICANDIVAISLIKHLQHTDVRVPESLFVTCFGDSKLSQLVKPSITTASLDHTEMGSQAVALYSYLCKQPDTVSASIRVQSKLLIRESTMSLEVPDDTNPHPSAFEPTSAVDFYSDSEVANLCLIDKLMANCDELDMEILKGIQLGITYENLADDLHTTASTLRYRIKRMQTVVDFDTREELLNLFEQYPLLLNVGTGCS